MSRLPATAGNLQDNIQLQPGQREVLPTTRQQCTESKDDRDTILLQLAK